ncbi:transmembrane protein [Tripterygium wilfordii]|uniref:Transmembrane protein n=1 Tax=Tripterygium wilfordii TaxID=458696 RepID=A0A7J7DA82_TRIWF|nr:transmembrane protein [Tripterygium wilfordii]
MYITVLLQRSHKRSPLHHWQWTESDYYDRRRGKDGGGGHSVGRHYAPRRSPLGPVPQIFISSKLSRPQKLHRRFLASLKNWLSLLLFWQYWLPFVLNLSASAIFSGTLSDSPISLAVPGTNATTFAATAVFGMLLGKETRLRFALLDMACIIIGAWLYIS